MVEQRSPMVAWLRKMVKRSNIESGDDNFGNHQEDFPIREEHSASSASENSELNSNAARGEGRSATSTPMITVDKGGAPAQKQRLNLQDSASVMTIASSSKRRRQSIDTNASTRAMAAESVFSWSAEKERDREAGTPGPDRGGVHPTHPEQSLSERVVSVSSSIPSERS